MTTTNSNASTKFARDLIAICTEMGLTPVSLEPTPTGLKENAGWAFLRLEGDHATGASLIIQKTSGKAPQVHSHVDLSGYDGYIPLKKPNGRVLCHFEPDLNKIKAVLHLFVGAKKRAKLASGTASQATPVTASEPTKVPSYTEQDFEDEARMYQTVGQAS